MDELIKRLASLQAERKVEDDAANAEVAAAEIDEEIDYLESQLAYQRGVREALIEAHTKRIDEIERERADVSSQIIDVWDGEKKTLKFDAGTLKFRTTTSLEIRDPGYLLGELIEHLSVPDTAKNYVTGFNKTAVKKFMGVIPQPPEVAELISKTTVSLEVSDGRQSQ